MRIVLTLLRLAALMAAALLALTLLRSHGAPPQDPDALFARSAPHLRDLQARAEAGGADAMQDLFPEGHLFTHALVGLAWVDVGLGLPVGDPRREEARRGALRALAAVDSDAGRAPFPAHLDPPHGAFYNGWTTQVRAGALLLAAPENRPADEVAALARACDTIAGAVDRSGSPFLPSYAGRAWPADSVVAVSALTHCDAILGPRHRATRDRWLRLARAEADPDLGVLGHGAFTGERRPRGTSLALMLRFLHDLDPDWARQHARVFRERFVTARLGIPAVHEHLDGGGHGDIDAGPLIDGVSLSATVVGAGSLRLYGDNRFADAVFGVGEVVGAPVAWPGVPGVTHGGRRYALGVLPVGEAFAAWSRTARPWHRAPEPLDRGAVPPWWWRLPWEGPGWLVMVGLAGVAVWPRRR